MSIPAGRARACARHTPSRPTTEQRAAESRRAAVQLSLTRLRDDLDKARVPAHRTMLERAIATLEAELASLR
ncbi:MAG: hypothetical protein QM736_13890 [Vicinamibacterales bacterium]